MTRFFAGMRSLTRSETLTKPHLSNDDPSPMCCNERMLFCAAEPDEVKRGLRDSWYCGECGKDKDG